LIYLLYILISAILCIWITKEKNHLFLIFYVILFYCLVEKIIFRTEEIFKTDIAQDFIIGIIGVLMIWLKYKKEK